METKISRAQLKNLFVPGTRLTLINCLMGPTNKPRTVHKATSYGFIMIASDKNEYSYLRYEGGERITFDRDSNVVTLYSKETQGTGEIIAAQYRIEGTAA
jgi:hypothetical protein